MLDGLDCKTLAFGSRAYWRAFELRNQVLRAPLGLGLREEALPKERESIHVGCYQGGKLVGAACFWPEPDGRAVVKHVAVAPDSRRLGVGIKLMEFLEREMRARGLSKSVLKARVSAKTFYQKAGYHPVGRVLQDRVPHQMMEKIL